MPKYITDLKIDKSNVVSGGGTKTFSVLGDEGAVFNMIIKRSNGNYYNFETRAFTSTFTSENSLSSVVISDGLYSDNVSLPENTNGDKYTFQLFPQPHFDTELKNTLITSFVFENDGTDTRETKNIFNKYYYEAFISQNAETTITFTLASKVHSSKYNSFGSDAANVQITGSPGAKNLSTTSISWKVTATDANDSCGFEIVRQPVDSDWEVSKTSSLGGTAYKVKGVATASKFIKLDTIDNIEIGDKITNNFSGGTAPEIVYINKEKGEVELDIVQTLADTTALTVTTKGPKNISSHTKGLVRFQNLKVQTADEYDGFNIKTSASHSGRGAIDIDDTLGLVLGLKVTGVDLGTEATITAINRSGNTVTLGSASYTLKDNAILKVTGGANEATITADVLITKFPTENTNITLDLDNILLPKGTT